VYGHWPQAGVQFGISNGLDTAYRLLCWRTTQVYGVFRTNSFRLRDAGEAGTQHGIFPTVSRANHSCLPTCFVEFGGTEAVSLRTICSHCCGHMRH
jgi:hypothetical protein